MNKSLKTVGIAVASLIVGVAIGVTTTFTAGKAASSLIGTGQGNIDAKQIDKINQLNKYIDNKYLGDYDKNKVTEGIYKGMFEALEDPYSSYMDSDEFKKFTEMTTGKFVGIGVVVSPNDDNRIQVVSVIKGGPAEGAGVKAGDIIWKVDGTEYSGQDMDKAVSIMKGNEGKPVKITILRENKDGDPEQIEKEIIRAEVINPSVEHKMLDDGIGYLQIFQFEDQTYNEFIEALNDLKAQGMKGLVIDIRQNGGGDLKIATDIIDELLPEGNIVYTEDKNGEREYINSDKNELEVPLAVLVSEYTASASEIMTAAVQDSKKGTIIGTKTYGKGVVQEVSPLPDGSAVKLTISEYFSPNGRSINKKGIEPDIKLELPDDLTGIGPDYLDQDNQLVKAIEVVKEKH